MKRGPDFFENIKKFNEIRQKNEEMQNAKKEEFEAKKWSTVKQRHPIL